jgi:hypothetical protein
MVGGSSVRIDPARERYQTFEVRRGGALAAAALRTRARSPSDLTAKASNSRRADGRVVIHLKRPWRDGPLGMVFELLDFQALLAALIPHPRTNTIPPDTYMQ